MVPYCCQAVGRLVTVGLHQPFGDFHANNIEHCKNNRYRTMNVRRSSVR